MFSRPRVQDLIEVVRREAGDDVLDQLAAARSLVAEVQASGDAMLGHFVDRARRAGMSWVDISDVLGVTKQAVHKRFATSVSELTLERLTPRARRALEGASERARSLGHPYVGTEHLLLGLYDEPEGVAAKTLAAAGIGPEAAEAAVVALTPQRDEVPDGDLRRTPRVNAALGNAVNVALELGHNYVGTEHILLGLYQPPTGLAAQILTRLGLGAEAARHRVIAVVAEFQQVAADDLGDGQ